MEWTSNKTKKSETDKWQEERSVEEGLVYLKAEYELAIYVENMTYIDIRRLNELATMPKQKA